MSTVTIPNAGTYDLLVDVGFLVDGFVLDDPVRGVLGGYATTTTRTNLVPNPSFETNTTSWTIGTGSTLTRTNAQSAFGTWSVSGTRTSTTGNISIQSAPRFTIVAGNTYTFSLYFRRDYSTTRTTSLRMFYYDSASVLLQSTTVAQTVPAQNTWGRMSMTTTAPANAVTVFVDVLVANAIVGETIFIDGVLMETGSSVLPYFDGTVADPYTGYTLTAQAWNGTTNNSTSTATWGLNSSFYAGNPLDGTTSYASVADGTTNVSVRRGRPDPDDQFTAGTMTFVLNDTLADGVFNPFDDDPTNPYYDQALGTPGLAPGRAVQLIRYDASNNPEYLFVGFIVNYEYQFRLGGLDTVTVFCADNLYRLANTGIEAQNPTKEFTGARINAILDLPEVDYPTGAARDIATGTVELGGSSQYAISQGTNVLAYFNRITATAERGRIFVDREGVLVSQNRIGATLSGPSVTFSDQGDVPYNDLAIDFKADQIINLVDVTTRGSHTAQAVDLASQAEYFVKALFITDSLLESTVAAQDLADYLLEPQPEPRFTSVQTFFGSCTTAERDSVAILEIGDTVLIQKEILIGGSPTLRGQESAIEGIEHRIDFAGGHTTRVFTSPTTIVYELILDDLNNGILDTNVLG